MIRSFYISTLEKLETAEKRVRADHEKRWETGESYGTSIFPLAVC